MGRSVPAPPSCERPATHHQNVVLDVDAIVHEGWKGGATVWIKEVHREEQKVNNAGCDGS